MNYRTQIVGTVDGRGTFGIVDIASQGGTWRSVGTTRTFWTASQHVRARTAADNIARRHFKQHFANSPKSALTITRV